jgi:hypothetical protein
LKLKFGDAAARQVSERIGAPTATTATLKATPADRRVDGQLFIVLSDSSMWVFDVDSSAGASSTVLVPDAGAGRFLAAALVASTTFTSFAGPRAVRGVVYANVSNLAAFTVSGNDGLTYVAGERVLLANQTTAAECGIYVVGTVSGTAPLTRADDWAAGLTAINGSVVEVSEGTIWAGSSWKAMNTGSVVINTTDPQFYPRHCKGVATLSSGIKALGSTEGLYLFSTTKSDVQLTLDTPAGTLGTWGYRSAVADRTAGKSGTGALTIRSTVDAGTDQVSDTSTVKWLVTNW